MFVHLLDDYCIKCMLSQYLFILLYLLRKLWDSCLSCQRHISRNFACALMTLLLFPHLVLFSTIRPVVKSFKVSVVEVEVARLGNASALPCTINSTPKK